MAPNFPIVFALYPHVTLLDFTGPHEVHARLPAAECILASSAGGDLEARRRRGRPTRTAR